MESDHSDLARAAGESSAAVAVTEATSSCQKKTKTQSTPTSGENSYGKIVGGQEQEREELEGLDWDDDKLIKEIDGCLRQLKETPFVYYGGYIDDEYFDFFDEQQQKVLNQRLALCRIRAYEEKYQDMDDETLSALFPPSDLEANETTSGSCFGKNGEYEKWKYYRTTCSTLEGDQEYVQFWEKLLSKSELIEWYITRSTYESRIGRLFHYHTLKIATVHPHVYKTLVHSGCTEFRHRLEIDFIFSRPWADFLSKMWKLLTGEKMSFKDALMRLYSDGKYTFMFVVKEFEPNLRPLEKQYKPFLDSIGEKSTEEAKGLIQDYITGNARKPKTYYDYAKKKLDIAKKIGLIPSGPIKAPRDKAVHGHTEAGNWKQ